MRAFSLVACSLALALFLLPVLDVVFCEGHQWQRRLAHCEAWFAPPSVTVDRARRRASSPGRAEDSDDAQLTALYERQADLLRTTLARLGVPPEVRDDLLQEAFTRAWAARHQLRDPAALLQWLSRIA